jgi:hypothetical protein
MPTDARSTTDPFLREVRERWELATDAFREIKAEGQVDMRYVSGDPWDPTDREAREAAGRPCLSLDELGQYFNQVINDIRANPRAVKFSPTGNGANDKTAEFYQDKMREIEYRSNAKLAYTTAFENAVQRSYGWARIKTDWKSPKSYQQEIVIEAVPNPDMVTPDPESQKPSGADMRYLFNFERWSVKEFERRFKNAEIRDFADYKTQYPSWIGDKTIVLAEYWYQKDRKRKLLLLQDPETQATEEVWADEYRAQQASLFTRLRAQLGLAPQLPQAPRVLKDEERNDPLVKMCLTNGLEVLESQDWAGRYIPFVSCLGKVIYLDEGGGAKRKILSMTRLARDPFMLYCYYRTAEAEQVGMATKFPYFVRRGSLKPEAITQIQKSLHEPVAVIEVEPFIEGAPPGFVPEIPVRNPFEPAIQALEIGAEGARRAIQAAMGISPLPTSAQRRNEKSGVALQQIEESQQRGTFHFVDNHDDFLTQIGIICEDLIPKIYDTKQETGIRDRNDNAKIVVVNDPNDPNSPSTKGDHLVTISTGKSFESSRQAANEFTDLMAGNLQQVAAVAGPAVAAYVLAKSIKLKDLGPIGDDIADAISPPPKGQNGEPLKPEQLQQALQQTQGQLQQVTQAAQAMEQKIATDEVKGQRDVALEAERQKAETDRERERIAADERKTAADNAAKLQLEKMKIVATLLQTQAKLDMQKAEMQVDATLRELDAQIGAAGADADRQAAVEGADKDRQAESQRSAADRDLTREQTEAQRDEAERDRAFQAGEAERARQAEADRPEAGA